MVYCDHTILWMFIWYILFLLVKSKNLPNSFGDMNTYDVEQYYDFKDLNKFLEPSRQ